MHSLPKGVSQEVDGGEVAVGRKEEIVFDSVEKTAGNLFVMGPQRETTERTKNVIGGQIIELLENFMTGWVNKLPSECGRET